MVPAVVQQSPQQLHDIMEEESSSIINDEFDGNKPSKRSIVIASIKIKQSKLMFQLSTMEFTLFTLLETILTLQKKLSSNKSNIVR